LGVAANCRGGTDSLDLSRLVGLDGKTIGRTRAWTPGCWFDLTSAETPRRRTIRFKSFSRTWDKGQTVTFTRGHHAQRRACSSRSSGSILCRSRRINGAYRRRRWMICKKSGWARLCRHPPPMRGGHIIRRQLAQTARPLFTLNNLRSGQRRASILFWRPAASGLVLLDQRWIEPPGGSQSPAALGKPDPAARWRRTSPASGRLKAAPTWPEKCARIYL